MSRSDVPQSAGIYMIVNTANDKFYIGSTKNLQSRWHTHLGQLKAYAHHNPHLQAAWNKYGVTCFVFQVIEILDDESLLLERETHWMRQYNAPENPMSYNIRPDATSNRNYKHSDEAKARMSIAQKKVNSTPERKAAAGKRITEYNLSLRGKPKPEAHRLKIAKTNTGKRHSPETRAKLSAANMGKPKYNLRGRTISEKHKASISAAHKGKTGALHNRSKSVNQYTIDGIFVCTFAGASEAARLTGITRTAISHCAQGVTKSAGGFVWRFTNV